MTKVTKTTPSTETQSSAVTVPAPASRPATITITENSPVAWAIATVHIRDGYIISPQSLPEVHGFTGHSTITLQLGEPDSAAITAAEAFMALAIELQVAKEGRENEARAQLLAEAKEREAKRQQVAEEIEETKKLLRRLTDQAAKI